MNHLLMEEFSRTIDPSYNKLSWELLQVHFHSTVLEGLRIESIAGCFEEFGRGGHDVCRYSTIRAYCLNYLEDYDANH